MKINIYKNSRKFEILNRIYALYDETMRDQETVCQKGCATCCTCNVTMTGLEAAYLTAFLSSKTAEELNKAITDNFPENRYVPKITTNQFARLCMEGKPVPEEENDPAWGKCPARIADICRIYEARPFGCRALMSSIFCADHGYAQVSPEIITTNTVFMQAIEHLDQNGISGNFSDIMPLFLDENLQPTTKENTIENIKKNGGALFAGNEKITILMVDPAHRKKLTPLVQALSAFLKKVGFPD